VAVRLTALVTPGTVPMVVNTCQPGVAAGPAALACAAPAGRAIAATVHAVVAAIASMRMIVRFDMSTCLVTCRISESPDLLATRGLGKVSQYMPLVSNH
jgi:hypothetical protein